ncbi:hypothetical protein [Methylocystis echinoides]|uniref:hypothetical protein n=1 Tax=Methylocystis echinoides TaxID=29468 RepID=UPI00343B4F2D
MQGAATVTLAWNAGKFIDDQKIGREDGEETGEISIDRMTEENDTSAPIEAICEMLCDKLIAEQEIACADPAARFTWVEGNRVRRVLLGNTGAAAH